MMEDKILKQNISRLGISDNALDILKNKNIVMIEQLCKKSKTELKDMELSQSDIRKIEIELQLLGYNLKNSLL